MSATRTPFGRIGDQPVDLFTLSNGSGVVIKVTNYGGIVTSIVVPDRTGGAADIACGFDTLEGYQSEAYRGNAPYFGCLVGRYAGRIKDGRFRVGDDEYQVAANDGPNHLHGGIQGFDKRVWDADVVDGNGVRLSLASPDGEEGYPGNLDVVVTYALGDDNALSVNYRATCDRTTPLSLTNHTYFNLNGFQDRVLDHTMTLAADRVLVPDDTNVPVGEERKVAGTVWDYAAAKPLGAVFGEEPKGFEHYYVFTKGPNVLDRVASFVEAASGRTLEVSTSEPGMLLYSGYYTSDALQRESGAPFGRFRGFCCETSRYPNGPNIPGAPGSLLEPGETYASKTVFRFGW